MQDVSIGRCVFDEYSDVKSGRNLDDDDDSPYAQWVTMTRLAW